MATMQQIRQKYAALDYVKQGKEKLLLDLIKKNPDVVHWTATDYKLEATFLYFAALKGHERIVKMLLDHGADPLAESNYGTIPLAAAIYESNKKSINLLLPRSTPKINDIVGYALNSPKDAKCCLLYCAGANEDVVRALMAAGADPHLPFDGKSKSLHSLYLETPEMPRSHTLFKVMAEMAAAALEATTPEASSRAAVRRTL